MNAIDRNISGYALKRRILRRMRERGIAADVVSRASRVRFPQNPARAILGDSLKVRKNRKHGLLTRVMYLAPEKLSVPYGGKNLCPWATTCVEPCLGTKGRLGPKSDGENAELWRTLTLVWARSEFRVILLEALGRHERHALRSGLIPGVRLNGASDVVWEATFPEIFTTFPGIRFYDYTKSLARTRGKRPPNYDLTFSFDGRNMADCLSVLRSGENVAIVFKDPSRILRRRTWHGFPVLDGDTHDARCFDPKGCWVILSVKGYATDETGFFA